MTDSASSSIARAERATRSTPFDDTLAAPVLVETRSVTDALALVPRIVDVVSTVIPL